MSESGSRDYLVEPQIVAGLRDQNVPVIYMSGHVAEMSTHATVAMSLTAMEEGAVTFLAKPFDEDALASEIDKAFLPDAGRPPEHQAYLHRLSKLTPREREVHDWMIKDKSSARSSPST